MKRPFQMIKTILAIALCVASVCGLVLPALASGEDEANAVVEQADTMDDVNSGSVEDGINSEGSLLYDQGTAVAEASDEGTSESTQSEDANRTGEDAQNAKALEPASGQDQDTKQETENTSSAADTGKEETSASDNADTEKTALTEEEAEEETEEEEEAEEEILAEDGDSELIAGVWYALNAEDKTASVTGGEASVLGSSLHIPATVTTKAGNTYRVTSIANEAFRNDSGTFDNIKSLTIDAGGVETIGQIAFYAMKLEGSLLLPEGVREIQRYAFTNAGFTGSLSLPDSLRVIGDYVFKSTGFTTVDLGEGVTTIGQQVLYNVPATGTLVIPDSVAVIGDWSFGMGNWSKIVIGNGLVNTGTSVFSYGRFEEVVLRPEVKLLGHYAFNNNKVKIASLTFEGVRDVHRHSDSNSVTEIYFGAFGGSTTIGDVYLPDEISDYDLVNNVMLYLGHVNCTTDLFRAHGQLWHVEDGVVYEIKNDALTLITTVMEYDDRDLTIPASVTLQGKTYPVTEIASGAFSKLASSSDKSPVTFTMTANPDMKIAADAFVGVRIEKIVIDGIEGCMDDVFAPVTGVSGDHLEYTIPAEEGGEEEEIEIDEAEVYDAAWLQKQIDEGKDVIAIPEEGVTMDQTVTVSSGSVTLLSNGKEAHLTATEELDGYLFTVSGSGTLTLQDAGLVLDAKSGALDIRDGGRVILQAGTVNGGVINEAYQGGVRVDDASLIVNGGMITGTTINTTESAAVFVTNGGSVEMSNGRIFKNKSTMEREATAGGVVLYGMPAGKTSRFHMTGGSITDNQSANGGGVTLMHDADFVLDGGEISYNKANGWYGDGEYNSGYGGGVFVYGAGSSVYEESALSRFTMNGGVLMGNEAKHGGGIFVDTNYVTLNGGQIVSNEAKYQGGGVYVSHEHRTMYVNNAVITGNTAFESASIVPQTGMGGGLWACPTGTAVLRARNGVAIFDNTAEAAGDDIVNTRGYDLHATLTNKIVGGGEAAYYEDGAVVNDGAAGQVVRSVKRFDAGNPGREVEAGDMGYDSFALKTVVSDQDKAAARASAALVISGNRARRGGGIGTNGNVIFGAQGGMTLEAKKSVNGEVPGEKDVFTFELLDGNGTVVQTVQNNGEKITFDDLLFNSAGTYVYTVREVKGTHPLVTYDESVYRVTFTVTDEGGDSLTTRVSYEKDGSAHEGTIVFANEKADPEPRTYLPQARKTLNGVAPGNNVFTFTLSENGVVIREAKNDAGGDVYFEGITYTEVGEHTYTLVETAGNEEGVIYDSAVYTLKVSVTLNEDESELIATGTWYKDGVVYTAGAPLFENKKDTYKPVITPVRVRFLATKLVNGADPGDRVFRFELLDSAGNLIQSTHNNGSVIAFREMSFEQTGTYTYTMREVVGNEQGITYDRTVYTATVTVTAITSDKGDVTYQATVVWSGTGSANPVFRNTYTPPEEPEQPTPNEPPQVLGARRTDSEDVLGARRAKTGDMSRTTNVAALAAALAGLMSLIIRGKKDGSNDNG